jgi:hypothetical protein
MSCTTHQPDCRRCTPLKARASRPSRSDTTTSIPTVSAATPLRIGRRHSSPPHRPFTLRRSSSPHQIPVIRAHTITSDFLGPPTSSRVAIYTAAPPPSSSDSSVGHRHHRSGLPLSSSICIYPICASAVYTSQVRNPTLRRVIASPSACWSCHATESCHRAKGRHQPRSSINTAREHAQHIGRRRGLRFSWATPSCASRPPWAT